MKKALIALSVAAGMIASAQAENTTTLYGSIGVETQVKKEGGSTSGTVSAVKDNKWNLDRQTAKFGVKGTEDLANGLQAFYKFEFGFNGDNGANVTRYAYLGLTGNFGTVTFGHQDSLYKVVTNKNDIFQNNYWGETVNFGAATGGGRINKVISYVSPNFNGFQFGVAGVLDGDSDVAKVTPSGSTTSIKLSDSKSFSAYQAGAWYNQNGFYAGVAYSVIDTGAVKHLDNSESIKVIGGAVGYSNDQFKVHLGVQNKSGHDGLGGVEYSDGMKYNLAGEYYSGPNTFRAAFGVADSKRSNQSYNVGTPPSVVSHNPGHENIYTYALGYQYNFSKRTYTYVEGEYIDWNKQFKNHNNGYTVRVGLRHDF